MLLVWLCCLTALLRVGNAQQDSFIVGGREVYPPGSYAYQCALYLNNEVDFNCGCVLITTKHVLTAAHCAENTVPSTYRILLGAHDRITQLDGQPEWYSVSTVVQHPDWRPVGVAGYPNDIAILTLTQDVNADNVYIETAKMPESGDETVVNFAGKFCNIIGWGQTSGSGQLPNVIREANIEVLTNSQCQTEWSGYPINDGHICALDLPERMEGSCYGDSGGCLICQYEAGSEEWTLAGLMSWLRTGCDTNWPSVYTRVSYFRPWVESQIGNITMLVSFDM